MYIHDVTIQIILYINSCHVHRTPLLVTHILLRNVSVLDRETPPSHACVIGLEQR